eukprot:3844660-Prymnesium_polylepis.2
MPRRRSPLRWTLWHAALARASRREKRKTRVYCVVCVTVLAVACCVLMMMCDSLARIPNGEEVTLNF